MNTPPPHVLIVGAGIGGLALAVGLHRAGVAVTVAEAAPETRPLGAGLSLWPNALHALDVLDRSLGQAVRAASAPVAGAMRDPAGHPLLELDPDRLAARLGEAPRALHRGALHALLLDAYDGPLLLGARFDGYSEDAHGVAARFADGRTLAADVLVGADGLRSAVRAALHGPTAPAYAGYTAWRAVVPYDGPLAPGELLGRGRRFGQVPLGDGQVYWFATADAPEGHAFREGAAAALRRLFAGWHPSVRGLLDATPPEALVRADLYDRPALRRWGRGRVTLLGDAAHPSTPNLGQGAGLALEDAAALAARLASGPAAEAALRAYEAERAPRAAAVVRESRRVGAVGQWARPLPVALRTALFRWTPPAALLGRTARFAAYTAFAPQAAA